nr:discoidin domain-containing protein [uncultured Draconibacterium sp.]
MRYLILLISILVFTNKLFAQFVDEATPSDVKPSLPSVPGSWELEFSDEFNGTEVNTATWNIDNSTKSRAARPKIGITDWRWKSENVSVDGGNLILKVFKTGSNSMTNGSIQTYSKYHTQYGYFEARIKIGDASKGTHTAFWLQGPNMGNVDGTANDGAEIDVFESAWTGDFTKSVVHIDGYGANHQANTKQFDTPGIHSGFHVWGFYWTPNAMEIYYDGVFKVRYSDQKWVVHSPEFLWLSNGASFGVEGNQYFVDLPIGYLTETQVDYIRVWKGEDSSDNDSTLSKENWQLLYADSEDDYGGNLATYAFDGNPYTFWHTEWKDNSPSYPHEIQIDLGDSAKIYAFNYLPRQDNNLNGNIAEYEFYASNDKQNWGEPLASGTFAANGDEKSVQLPDTVVCKYVRLVALSEVNSNAFTNVAELSLMGYYTKDISTGVSSVRNKPTIKAYPNPFTNEINVSLDLVDGISLWRIVSMDGRILKEAQVSHFVNELHITTTDLPAGMYMLEVATGKGRDVKLMVKK